MAQPSHAVEQAAKEGFNAGETIIEHVANSSHEHPLIHLPSLFGIDMSVTKHVLMLWIVAALVFTIVTVVVRRYLKQDRLVPSGFMTALEIGVEYVRDEIVRPNVGNKHVNGWSPLLLSIFFFILAANLIGLFPVFDALALLNHTVLHLPEESFLTRVTQGGITATGNFNVTAALATITFFSIIIAGTRAHGFVQHWKNLVPHGVPLWLYPLLVPLEVIGLATDSVVDGVKLQSRVTKLVVVINR